MTPSKRSRKEINSILPWYVTGTLGANERRQAEDIVNQAPEMKADLESWQSIREAVVGQPEEILPHYLQQRVLARVRASKTSSRPVPVPGLKLDPLGWLSAGLLALSVLILLWLAIRPGVELTWRAESQDISSFRVLRSPSGSDDFKVIGELPVTSGAAEFSFLDFFIIPGKTYEYRIEGIGTSGDLSLSQPITNNPLAALPGQIAVLFTSMLVGYCLYLLLSNLLIQLPFTRKIA